MKFARSLVLWALACSLSVIAPTQGHAQETASAHADHLLKADRSWNGKPYTHYPSGQPTLMMIKLTIPPHTALPWHTHPVPNAGYVLQGQLTIQDKASGASHVFHQARPLPKAWMTLIVVYPETGKRYYFSPMQGAIIFQHPSLSRVKRTNTDRRRQIRFENDLTFETNPRLFAGI